jgi:soluble lytic murein transglycosylase-like protein
LGQHSLRIIAALGLAALLSACSSVAGLRGLDIPSPRPATLVASTAPAGSLSGLIAKYAALYEIPESLIHRIIQRESGYNSAARNGPYYGLMQIRYDTAMTMGYRGPASGLLDADTNLRYGVKYLAGAYVVAGGNADGAMRGYASGYYYDAKAQGLLEQVGLR